MNILDKEGADKLGAKETKFPNIITFAKHEISACQIDVLFMLIASLKEGQTKYTINANDIELITGRSWNIGQLTKSTEKLITRMFEKETEEKYTQFVLFQYFEYMKGTRSIDIQLTDISLPILFDLKKGHTQFQLKSLLDCSSKFAKVMYMVACKWLRIGHFPEPMEILDFKEMLGLYDKETGKEQFERISDFKRDILEKAKAQINEFTDLDFSYKLYKRGRSFTHIQIFVKKSKKNLTQLAINFHQTPQFQMEVKNVEAYGFTTWQAELIVNAPAKGKSFVGGYKGFEELRDKFMKMERKGDLHLQKDAVSYFIGVYANLGVDLKQPKYDIGEQVS